MFRGYKQKIRGGSTSAISVTKFSSSSIHKWGGEKGGDDPLAGSSTGCITAHTIIVILSHQQKEKIPKGGEVKRCSIVVVLV